MMYAVTVEPVRRRPKDTTEPGDMRVWSSMSVQRLVPTGSLVLLIARMCNVEGGDEVTVLLVGRHLREFRTEATRSLSAHTLIVGS